MFVAGWSFTSLCNMRCIHCYNKSGIKNADELTEEQAKIVVKRLRGFGVDAVNFGGGECPLREDFIEICKLLYDAGIKISLTTNGSTYEKIKDYLYLFHDIGVSIDFADKKKHDSFRGFSGAYEKAIRAIKLFVKNGVDTEIVTCITKMNCNEKELRKLYKLAKSLKVNYWRLNRYEPTGRKENIYKLELDSNDLKKAFRFLNKLIEDEGFVIPDPLFNILGRQAGNCPCGKTSFRIQPNGEITPCVYLHVSGGNILKNSLTEILDSDIFKKIRNRNLQDTKCAECFLKERCNGGCAGCTYITYGTFDRPDPLCWINPEKSKNREWNVHEKYLCTVYVPIGGNEHDIS